MSLHLRTPNAAHLAEKQQIPIQTQDLHKRLSYFIEGAVIVNVVW